MNKRTFREGDCLVGIPNSFMYAILLAYAKEKGVPVYRYSNEASYNEYPNIIFCLGELSGKGNDNEESQAKITFEQFFEYCNNWKGCHPKKIKLSAEYEAVITKDEVTVGTLTFTHEAIEIIYKAMKEVKP